MKQYYNMKSLRKLDGGAIPRSEIEFFDLVFECLLLHLFISKVKLKTIALTQTNINITEGNYINAGDQSQNKIIQVTNIKIKQYEYDALQLCVVVSIFIYRP